MLGSLIKPANDCHTSYQQKRREHFDISLRQRPVHAIAFEKRVAGGINVRGDRVFNQRRCDIVHMPTVCRIVEIYQRQITSISGDVLGMEIGMNQTKIIFVNRIFFYLFIYLFTILSSLKIFN